MTTLFAKHQEDPNKLYREAHDSDRSPIPEASSTDAGAIAAVARALPKEKWLLASLLQKAIRRGHVRLAAGTALALGHVDLAYVLRRLPVIAYEDIGVANPRLLILAKYLTNAIRPQRPDQLKSCASNLAALLASSPKSRTACDILSLISLRDTRRTDTSEDTASERSPSNVVALAQNRGAPVFDRAIAFRMLLNGRHCTAADRAARFAQFCKTAATMGAPDEVLEAVQVGGATYNLNCFLPLAHELVFGLGQAWIRRTATSDAASEGFGYVLPCALDMFTRVGQSAYRYLIAAERELHVLLQMHLDNANRVHAIGTLLFYAEGSALDRAVVSGASQKLLRETERAEERACGFRTQAGAREVRHWLVRHADRVASARKVALARSTCPTSTMEAD